MGWVVEVGKSRLAGAGGRRVSASWIAVAGGFEALGMEPTDDNGSRHEAISVGCQNRDTASRVCSANVLRDVDPSVQTDAEVERTDVFPVSLVVSIGEQVVEHAIHVEAVVEYEGTDRRRDS